MAPNEDLYETADLGLAASLITSNIRLEKINKSNPNRVIFFFKDNVTTQSKVKDFWNKDLFVPALTLLENIRLLKARIYG